VSQVQMRNLAQQREQRGAFSNTTEAIQAAQIPEREWGRVLDAWTTDRRTFLPGKLNVNTAPALALRTIPGLSGEVVESIMNRRRELPGGLDWTELLDLLTAGRVDLAELTVSLRFERESTALQAGVQPQDPRTNRMQGIGTEALEQAVCFRSAVYFVRCLVREAGSQRTEAAMAVVYLPPEEDGAARIVQWRRPDRFPGWTAWFRPAYENEGMTSDR
jgi:hypothetical protein